MQNWREHGAPDTHGPPRPVLCELSVHSKPARYCHAILHHSLIRENMILRECENETEKLHCLTAQVLPDKRNERNTVCQMYRKATFQLH